MHKKITIVSKEDNMNQNNLITYYDIKKFSFKNIFSTGSELYFERPCIGYIKKGYVQFFHSGKTTYAYEGDLIYIPFETKHQSIWYGSPDIDWYSIQFDFTLKHSLFDYRFQILNNYPSQIIEKMVSSFEESYFLSVSFFYRLLDDVYKKMKITPTSSVYLSIKPAIDFVENNYEKPICIDNLADLCNMSRSAFFKSFRKALNVTPIEYKHNIMIQHAIDLISSTGLSIEEISTMVGFPSSNYFRKVFFKFTEKTPKELRKK